MKRNLVLLTKNYPYGMGEDFIDGEIRRIAGSFNRITVVASQVQANAVQTKSVPEGVDLLRMNGLTSAFGKLLFCLYGLKELPHRWVWDELRRAPSLVAKGAVVYYCGKVSYLYPKVRKALLSTNCAQDDSTVFYSYWLYDTADIACRLRDDGIFAKGSKAVSRGHGYDVYANRNCANWIPFQNDVIRRLDGAYICSDDGRDYLISHYPESRDRIQTMYLGTDDMGIGCGSDDGMFRLVSCSWLAALKRTDILIDALKIAQDMMPGKLIWTCIGDGDLLEHYKNRAKSELKNMQTFFAGALRRDELYAFYREECVDLFVSVSESEGLPVSIMEAQSFGIPSLATDAGGTREITKTGLTGKLIPIDSSAQEIAEAICGFAVATQFARGEERTRCRAYWREHFDADVNCNRLQRIFISLIGD